MTDLVVQAGGDPAPLPLFGQAQPGREGAELLILLDDLLLSSPAPGDEPRFGQQALGRPVPEFSCVRQLHRVLFL